MAPFVHGTWNSTVPKLVFSRCLGKPSTATRHLGPKTGTVFSVRENPSKSPKRPALPGAVNREGAVLRHRPFVLLFFHTPSAAHLWPFSTGLTRAQIRALGAWVGSFPRPGGEPGTQGQTVANRGLPSLGCCWAQKSRCPVLSDSGFGGYDCVCWNSSDSSSSSGPKRYFCRR